MHVHIYGGKLSNFCCLQYHFSPKFSNGLQLGKGITFSKIRVLRGLEPMTFPLPLLILSLLEGLEMHNMNNLSNKDIRDVNHSEVCISTVLR